ncbi:hypothetical protein ACFE04_013323 [Oxalis oulophora]
MAIHNNLMLALFVVVTFSSINVGLSARNLLQIPALPTIPISLPKPTVSQVPVIPTLPQPTVPNFPITQPSLNLPKPTLPSIPTIPNFPSITTIPNFPSLPTIPNVIPTIPNGIIPTIPFFSPPSAKTSP